MENSTKEGFTEIKQKLYDCIKIMIENWSILNMALEKGWGEKYKSRLKLCEEVTEKKEIWNMTDEQAKENLINELTNYVYDYDVSNLEIEDFLLDYMEQNYFVLIEDESERQIADWIINLNKELNEDKDTIYNKIMSFKKSESKVESNKNNTEDKINEEEQQKVNDKPKNEPEIDEDGFIMVKTKKGKRN